MLYYLIDGRCFNMFAGRDRIQVRTSTGKFRPFGLSGPTAPMGFERISGRSRALFRMGTNALTWSGIPFFRLELFVKMVWCQFVWRPKPPRIDNRRLTFGNSGYLSVSCTGWRPIIGHNLLAHHVALAKKPGYTCGFLFSIPLMAAATIF